MSTKRSIIGLATIVLGAALLVSSTAAAQGHTRGARTAVRAARPLSSAISRPSRAMNGSTAHRLQRSSSHSRAITPRTSGSYSNRSPYSLGDVLGAIDNAARNRNSDYFDPRNGYYGGHDDPYRSTANAYRDVGIANALVNIVGILANSQLNNQVAQPVYQPAPPSGHYERHQVVIKEGYYEDVQVWVPEYQVEQTREIVAGHYETHRRWVPPVYGYQDVWVP